MRMTMQVISFNRHFFALAGAACIVGISLIVVVQNPILKAVLAFGAGFAVYFMVSSVIASYCVYDASDLYKLNQWPDRALENPPGNGIVVHAGFDPASHVIAARFPRMRLRVLDFFNPRITTEASIQMARRLNPPPTASEQIAADEWPVTTGTQDAVFALSAAHELRKTKERVAFFCEARRVLKEGGQVIVIEQLRDCANFACFGLAAYHFLSRRTWLTTFASAELQVIDEFKISPFMSAFVLRPSLRSE